MAGSPVITVRFANPELNCKDLPIRLMLSFSPILPINVCLG